MGVGGFVWSSIVSPLSQHRRTYALDTIGDLGKGVLTDPAVLGPMLSYVLRPTDAKLDWIIDRSLGAGETVNREFRPWMRILGRTKARVGQPLPLSGRKRTKITAPTLLFLGGKDGLVGSPRAAAKRARRCIGGCSIEILPEAGHVMSVDEPDHVAARIVEFLA